MAGELFGGSDLRAVAAACNLKSPWAKNVNPVGESFTTTGRLLRSQNEEGGLFVSEPRLAGLRSKIEEIAFWCISTASLEGVKNTQEAIEALYWDAGPLKLAALGQFNWTDSGSTTNPFYVIPGVLAKSVHVQELFLVVAKVEFVAQFTNRPGSQTFTRLQPANNFSVTIENTSLGGDLVEHKFTAHANDLPAGTQWWAFCLRYTSSGDTSDTFSSFGSGSGNGPGPTETWIDVSGDGVTPAMPSSRFAFIFRLP